MCHLSRPIQQSPCAAAKKSRSTKLKYGCAPLFTIHIEILVSNGTSSRTKAAILPKSCDTPCQQTDIENDLHVPHSDFHLLTYGYYENLLLLHFVGNWFGRWKKSVSGIERVDSYRKIIR